MTAHVKQEKESDAKVASAENGAQVSTSKRTRSYESRKIRKPLMEKKRRARINESLNELKQILLEANGTAPATKQGNRPAKLEKADILELTLKFVKSLHNNNKNGGKNNNKPITTCISDSSEDEHNNHNRELKIDTTSTSSTCSSKSYQSQNSLIQNNNINDDTNSKFNNGNVETPFIHGFAECVRLVQSSMKTMASSQIQTVLEEKLRNHLAELNREKSKFEMRHFQKHHQNDSPMSIDDHDTGFGSGDEHDTMTLRSADSPASISQLSPVSVSGRSNGWIDSNHLNSGFNRSGTLLIPTRMNNGEIAFVLKCSEQNRGENNQHFNNQGAFCEFTDAPINHSFSYRTRYGKTFTGYTDNQLHIANSRVWRPW